MRPWRHATSASKRCWRRVLRESTGRTSPISVCCRSPSRSLRITRPCSWATSLRSRGSPLPSWMAATSWRQSTQSLCGETKMWPGARSTCCCKAASSTGCASASEQDRNHRRRSLERRPIERGGQMAVPAGSTATTASPGGPLTGLRVIELGHFVAAPFCTRILGDLGADVIKVEPPAGDPVRQWGRQVEGTGAPWWSMHARNKRCISMNLKKPEATQLVLRLVAKCDALVENFRPGQLAKMGLSREKLEAARPSLIVAQISGYGQDGVDRDRAAFGVIGEAIGGLRHHTDHPPRRTRAP